MFVNFIKCSACRARMYATRSRTAWRCTGCKREVTINNLRSNS